MWLPSGRKPARLHRSFAFDRFESLTTANKKCRYPDGYLHFLAEDEGFEPPQTESESGVLPLHKSSKCGKSLMNPIVTEQQSIDRYPPS